MIGLCPNPAAASEIRSCPGGGDLVTARPRSCQTGGPDHKPGQSGLHPRTTGPTQGWNPRRDEITTSTQRARATAKELDHLHRLPDTYGVAGSNPVVPTVCRRPVELVKRQVSGPVSCPHADCSDGVALLTGRMLPGTSRVVAGRPNLRVPSCQPGSGA